MYFRDLPETASSNTEHQKAIKYVIQEGLPSSDK
jgi:hypothetical protein